MFELTTTQKLEAIAGVVCPSDDHDYYEIDSHDHPRPPGVVGDTCPTCNGTGKKYWRLVDECDETVHYTKTGSRVRYHGLLATIECPGYLLKQHDIDLALMQTVQDIGYTGITFSWIVSPLTMYAHRPTGRDGFYSLPELHGRGHTQRDALVEAFHRYCFNQDEIPLWNTDTNPCQGYIDPGLASNAAATAEAFEKHKRGE